MKHILTLPDGKTMEITTPIVRGGGGTIKRLPEVLHVPYGGSSVRLTRTAEGPPVTYHPAPPQNQPTHGTQAQEDALKIKMQQVAAAVAKGYYGPMGLRKSKG